MPDLPGLLARLGARPDGGIDPADFGDAAAEVGAAETAVVAGCPRWKGLVRVGGAESTSFLQRLLSCDLREVTPGASVPGCLLSPTGRAVAVVLCLRSEEEVLLEVERPFAPLLAQTLEGYRFAEAVGIADDSGNAPWLLLLGPDAPAALRALGISEPPSVGRHRSAQTPEGPVRVARTDLLGVPEFRLLTTTPQAASLLERLLASVPGARPIGSTALERLRILRGVPRQGFEVDEAVYPEEVGLESSLSTAKGCYPGQEVVAKIRTYGGAKRRLLLLRFGEGARPSRGDPVEANGTEVGRVTSASADPSLGPPLALALVRREAAAAGAEVRVSGREGPLRALAVPLGGASRTGPPPARVP